MKFTILGASGFIGSNIVAYLKQKNYTCFCPPRDYVFQKKEPLGHLIYCIGLTSDFRQKPFETIEAHVCKLNNILQTVKYDSFLYLSSTRVYSGVTEGLENKDLQVNPHDFSDLYNISKIMGESICLLVDNPMVRVVRLSNVVGEDFSSGNFLFSLIKDAVEKKLVTLYQPMNIERDFILIDDVLDQIEKIVMKGQKRMYNLAAGKNISNKDILTELERITGCVIEAGKVKERLVFPRIDTTNLKKEFSFNPRDVFSQIKYLISNYQKQK